MAKFVKIARGTTGPEIDSVSRIISTTSTGEMKTSCKENLGCGMPEYRNILGLVLGCAISHHQQGRIDFNTVNPSLPTGKDFPYILKVRVSRVQTPPIFWIFRQILG